MLAKFLMRKKSVLSRARAAQVLLLLAALLAASARSLAQPASDDANRRAIALEALSRLKGMDLEANPALKTAVLKVVDTTKGTAQFVDLVKDFKLKGQAAALLEYAAQHPAESSAAEAMRLVLAEDTDLKLVQTALASTNAAGVAEALGNTSEKAAVPILQKLFADEKQPEAVRKKAVKGLTQSQDGAAILLALARDGKLAGDYKAVASAELNRAPWPAVKDEAARLLPILAETENTPLPPVTELVKLKGDAKHGAEVFARETVGCLNCHQVNGKGVDFGPNLSEIGAKLGKDALYAAILEPSAGISFGFEAWQIEFKDGEETYGLLASETADEVSVKTQNGIVTRYKKSEIARRQKSTVSIMPGGLQDIMARQELIDLVEYLATLKKTDGK